MQIAIVLGRATATIKHATLENQKLLVAQPQLADGLSPDGEPLLVVDHLGAGAGERVILTNDAALIKEMFHTENSPIRWTTLGLVDR